MVFDDQIGTFRTSLRMAKTSSTERAMVTVIVVAADMRGRDPTEGQFAEREACNVRWYRYGTGGISG